MADDVLASDDGLATDDARPGEHDLGALGLRWKAEIERATRYFQEWTNRCKKIEKLYLAQQNENSSDRAFPMLWANISVLQPAVYARAPQPAVERRFKDPDPLARAASELLERALAYQTERDDLDSLMRQCRDDFLLFARGAAWLRYEADIEADEPGDEPSEELAQEQAEQAPMSPEERITGERVCIDYVHWSDFLHEPARRWGDVGWVARRVPMTKDELNERFGEEAVTRMMAEVVGRNSTATKQDRAQDEGKTGVWEIWSKADKMAIWIADGSAEALEAGDPPLDLDDFFPCPRPCYGTTSTGALIPIPDYVYYQGQVDEINTLTRRIAKLTDQLKLKGFYPAGEGDVSDAIEAALTTDNDDIMVPIPSWAAFSEKGGADAVVWLPIKEVQAVISACIEARKQLIEDVYQITGISDIVRGDSKASETATAQRIKSQWGSIRIRDRQAELARFARDIVRIAGEIIADLFQPETLLVMTDIRLPTMADKQQAQMQAQQIGAQWQQAAQAAQQHGQQPPPQPKPPQGFQEMMQSPTIDEVVQLLRNDALRGFRIDIETDSTIEPDENAEKQRRIEFVQAVGGFIAQAVPVVEKMPTLVPAIGEIILFVARGFRAGRQLENVLEQAIGQTAQQIMAPKPPPQPSPDEMAKTQAEMAKSKAAIQTAQIRAQAEQAKAQLSVQAVALDHHVAERKAMRDMQMAEQQHAMEMQRAASAPRLQGIPQ